MANNDIGGGTPAAAAAAAAVAAGTVGEANIASQDGTVSAPVTAVAKFSYHSWVAVEGRPTRGTHEPTARADLGWLACCSSAPQNLFCCE
jgi:hypothetical protein